MGGFTKFAILNNDPLSTNKFVTRLLICSMQPEYAEAEVKRQGKHVKETKQEQRMMVWKVWQRQQNC